MPVIRLLSTLTNTTLVQRRLPVQRKALSNSIPQPGKSQLTRNAVKNGCRDFGYLHPDAFELISNLVGCIEA